VGEQAFGHQDVPIRRRATERQLGRGSMACILHSIPGTNPPFHELVEMTA